MNFIRCMNDKLKINRYKKIKCLLDLKCFFNFSKITTRFFFEFVKTSYWYKIYSKKKKDRIRILGSSYEMYLINLINSITANYYYLKSRVGQEINLFTYTPQTSS